MSTSSSNQDANPEATSAAKGASDELISVQIDSELTALVAATRSPRALLKAQKAFAALGIDTDRVLVVCDDQPLRRQLYAEQVPVNGPPRHAFAGKRALFGGLLGCVAFGIFGFMLNWIAGALGMLAGFAAGMAVAIIISLDADNRPVANQVYALCKANMPADFAGLAIVAPQQEWDSEKYQSAREVLAALHAE